MIKKARTSYFRTYIKQNTHKNVTFPFIIITREFFSTV